MAKCTQANAVISLSGDDQVVQRIPAGEFKCFHVTKGVAGANPISGGERVRFADGNHVDKRLRGRTIWHKPLPNLSALRPEAGDEVLAWYGASPVWALRQSSGLSVNIVSVPLPKLADGQPPFDYLNSESFIHVLPLLHFLRQVTADSDWTRPPLRACLMFDDPNLHWTSYGFLPYQEVARQAKSCGFHVAFATIPFDTWFSHRRAVNLFKDNPELLSLLIHGNDHLRSELGRPRTPEGHLRVLAQGLRRVARLERTTGLCVDRVMAPPHGAYADAALAAMLALGFEGVCISTGSLRNWNPHRQWSAAFGLEMAEMMEGFPVLPRFRLSASCEAQIIISAFLDRPIIPVGHHDTVADGLELLSRVAEVINSLGDVSWGSCEMMLHSNYLKFRGDATLWVKSYSSRILVTVPPGVTTIVLENPDKEDGFGVAGFRIAKGGDSAPHPTRLTAGEPISVKPGETVELVSQILGNVDYRRVKPRMLSVWAFPRRILCEGRDRLAPLIYRVRKRRVHNAG